jgi:hypothetical protein
MFSLIKLESNVFSAKYTKINVIDGALKNASFYPILITVVFYFAVTLLCQVFFIAIA